MSRLGLWFINFVSKLSLNFESVLATVLEHTRVLTVKRAVNLVTCEVVAPYLIPESK